MKRIICLLMLAGLTLVGRAETRPTTVRVNGGETRVTFLSSDIVRVEHGVALEKEGQKSLVVTMQPEANVRLSVKETPHQVSLTSQALTVLVSKDDGQVQFLTKGKNLLREKQTSLSPRLAQTYLLDKDEPIYGLGALQDGQLNRRGTDRRMMEQSNQEDYQYVIQSIKGWGIYWDNYSRADFRDTAEGMTFSPETGDRLDYYFMYGRSADGVNRLMRQLSGQVPMFPLWTFGYWQCRERYKSSRELLSVVDWHRKNGVPLDGIIQDWQYWGSNYLWNAMDFLNEEFSDGERMVQRVHEQNAHLMISIWASFGPMTKQYRELNEKGLLFDFETWPQSGSGIWPPKRDYPSGVRVYDPYSQEARDIYWRHLRRLHDYGVDAWWMDSTDPDQFDVKDEDYDHPVGQSPSLGIPALGTYRSHRNAFPLASVSGVYQNQRANDKDKRVFIMTRSAFAGQQRYGAGLWSGDITSSWDVLRRQIPLCLNYTMTGCPNINTDIGGFFCGRYGGSNAPRNPRYQELYVRWLQFGLMCPVFRSHGTDAPREIYQFGKRGEPVFDAIEKTIQTRYRLLPYIYSTAWQVTHNGESYMRALVYDFPSDRRTWDLTDEFLFGRSLLALPIVRPQYTDEETNGPTDGIDFTAAREATKYLPQGADWYDFWTERRYQGGQDGTIPTSFAQAPMMVRAGSILPLAPVLQYAQEHQWDDLELVVYPGADGQFTLYEDEGDSYRYEQGQCSTIPMKWDDTKRQLTIARREGQFPGMLGERSFRIRLAGTPTVRTVRYSGKEVKVKI